MLVEPYDEADIVHARLERPHCGDQRRPSGGASVLDVGERKSGRSEVGDHRVRVTTVLAPTVGELHVAPCEPGVSESCSDRMHTHPHGGDPLVPTEGVNTRTNDHDLTHAGANT